MTFLFPAMLAGLAAIAVPIVLHLIAQQRFPIQPIPNIRLIETERRTNSYAMRPIDLIQLLLRIIVVAAVIFAMTRPATHSGFVGRSARNIVIVLDCSPSMLARVGDTDRNVFEHARAEAIELVRQAGPHDRIAYIEAGAEAVVRTSLTADAAQVESMIEAAAVQYSGGGSIASSIAQACRILMPRREYSSEIIVLSDMRGNMLERWDDSSAQTLASVRERLGDRLALSFVDFMPEDLPNLGITDVRLSPGRVSTGADAHLATTIRNISDEDVEVPVTLAIRRTAKLRRRISVPARSEAIVDLVTSFDAPVNTFCRIELDANDGLAVDDRFDVPIRLDRRFEVLIVDGSSAHRDSGLLSAKPEAAANGSGRLTGAGMLEFALNPAQFAASEGRSGGRNTFVRRVTLDAVNTAMLGTVQLVVLYNVDRLPQRTLEDLREHVKNGRSVMIIAGNSEYLSLIDFRTHFSHPAGDDAVRLSPADVDNVVNIEPGTKIVLGEHVHPVMEPFRDLRRGDLGSVNFAQLRRLAPVEGAEVIFRVGDLPAAVEMQAIVPGDNLEQQHRRGRICVLGFGFESEWSNFAQTRVFVPLIWRIADYIAERMNALPVDMVRAGERLVLDCSEFVPAPYVSIIGPDDVPVTGPDGWPLELPLSDTGSAVLSGLTELGAYRVTVQGLTAVEIRLADGTTAAGQAYTSAVREAIAGRLNELVVRSQADATNVHQTDVAGGSFRESIVVRANLSLADGNVLECNVPGALLDNALSGRSDLLNVQIGGTERQITAGEMRKGAFAGSVNVTMPRTADPKERFLVVNPPASETDTTPIEREAIAAALGDAGWSIENPGDALVRAQPGREWWHLLAIVLLLAYFAEAVVGHWLSYRRELTRFG